MDSGIRRGVLIAVAAVFLAWQPLPAIAAGNVDLSLYYDEPAVSAGGDGIQTVTVTNSGADSTAPAELVFTTPVFVTVARMPAGCGFLYQDTASGATVPSVVRCALPPLAHGESVDVRFGLTADADAADGVTYGEATVLPGGADVDQHLADNLGWPSVVIAGAPTVLAGPGFGHVTDLYVTTDLPALAVGAPGAETLTVGSRGPEVTTGPARLVLVTPSLTRAVEPLPDGCGFRYDSADVGSPQVIGCTLSASLASGASIPIRIPLSVLFGSPVQTSWGVADVFPDSADVDPVLANNVVESGVQVVG